MGAKKPQPPPVRELADGGDCLPFVWRRTSESVVILVIWLEKYLSDEDTRQLADYLKACHELRKTHHLTAKP